MRFHSDFIQVSLREARGAAGRVVVAGMPPFPSRTISEEDARLLRSADRFRSVSEHVDELFRRGQIEGDRQRVEELYRRLLEQGLLVSLGEVRDRISRGTAAENGGSRPADSPSIAWHVWPTKNRPHELRRSLESWLVGRGERDGPRRILVCDDSEEPLARRNRELLATFDTGHRELYFVSRDARRSLTRALSRAGFSGQLLSFALQDTQGFAAPMSLNRNAALIVTAGSAFASTDDDTVCRFARPPDHRQGLRFYSDVLPETLGHFGSRDRLLEMADHHDVNPWAEHERFLGATPPQLISDHDVDFSELRSRDVGRLVSANSHVLLSTFGSVGNTGLPANRIALRLRRREDHSLWRPEDYLAAVTSNDGVRVGTMATIAFAPSFMAMSFAADNRRLLPPFFPVGRAMDALWGTTAAQCDPKAVFAHLPWAIAHDPPGDRSTTREAVRVYRPMLAEYLRVLVTTAVIPSAVPFPRERMARLGRELTQIASLAWSDFQGAFWERWIAVTDQRIAQLTADIEEFDYQPRVWAEDVRRYFEALRKWGDSRELPLPVDLPQEDDQSAKEHLLRLIRLYGELLVAWPDWIEAAARLGVDGSNAVGLYPIDSTPHG